MPKEKINNGYVGLIKTLIKVSLKDVNYKMKESGLSPQSELYDHNTFKFWYTSKDIETGWKYYSVFEIEYDRLQDLVDRKKFDRLYNIVNDSVKTTIDLEE